MSKAVRAAGRSTPRSKAAQALGLRLGTQISTVRAALRSRAEEEILQYHIAHCVEHPIASGDRDDLRTKIAEIIDVLGHSNLLKNYLEEGSCCQVAPAIVSQVSTRLASSALLLTFALSLSAAPGQATPAQTPSDPWHIHSIAVDVRDPSRLFVATHHGLFLTSGDRTATQTSDNVNDFMAFAPDPADADIFFASGHPANGGNLGVIISRDGGKSWQLLSEGINGPVDFHLLTVSQANPDVMYGLFRDIQVSRDRGKNWEHAGSPPSEVFDLAALIHERTDFGIGLASG